MFIEDDFIQIKYNKIKLLGKGFYGKAILAKDKFDNSTVVIKHVILDNMNEKEKDSIHQEGHLLEKLEHKNIISFKSFTYDRSNA